LGKQLRMGALDKESLLYYEALGKESGGEQAYREGRTGRVGGH